MSLKPLELPSGPIRWGKTSKEIWCFFACRNTCSVACKDVDNVKKMAIIWSIQLFIIPLHCKGCANLSVFMALRCRQGNTNQLLTTYAKTIIFSACCCDCCVCRGAEFYIACYQISPWTGRCWLGNSKRRPNQL